MAKKLKGHMTFTDPKTGMSETFGPLDELPEWAAALTDESDFEGDPEDEEEVASGPGQLGPPDESEEDKAERRKKADRDRKAAQRAAEKKAKEDAEALEAAQAAEAQRAAEEEAARKAAEQGQGGGS